ncbi:DUF3231 family protein [Alkalihalobacillus hemicellulosilyticus]|uniref:DUF3231 domain-containing protein n=1 Tax=Halalkalibacter hemicellulosilyticusJCM 9152 TaxID=1236971 RepID=W4QCF6_9BACI|nr:DUF3231 family protein [Halalkalibacter hemicellulosilyticus]GAE29358.1 hypothetical protein JCM9152_711 [Halalkalibacter hemicellulosilyticusJCM 9152]
MGILSGNPQEEPMHYGEVFCTWGFLHAAKLALISHQTLLNHTGDEDLRKFLTSVMDNAKQEIEQLEKLLKENEIALPPSPPERPNADLESIPVGARFNDPEIAAMLSADIGAGLIACSKNMAQGIREDIIMMFDQFHTQKATLGGKLLRMTKEKGWLVPPPLHLSKAE